MKLLIILLLCTSCASGLKSYSRKTIYTEVGIKCAQEYYYSLRYGKCVYMPPTYSPSGISSPPTITYTSSPDRRIALNAPVLRKTKTKVRAKTKINCKVILDNINKCSL